MKSLKLFKTSLIFSFTLLVTSCKTTVPTNDIVKPEILVSVVEPNLGNQLIASTDPNIHLASFICPNGTNNVGDSKAHYVTKIVNDTVDFRITSTDKGGVKAMSVNVLHNQVSNIRVLNSPEIVPNVIRSANDVRISVTFDNPKTAQILAFEVNRAGSSLVIETSAYDFSNNLTSIPTINTTEPRIQILDISNCNN